MTTSVEMSAELRPFVQAHLVARQFTEEQGLVTKLLHVLEQTLRLVEGGDRT